MGGRSGRSGRSGRQGGSGRQGRGGGPGSAGRGGGRRSGGPRGPSGPARSGGRGGARSEGPRTGDTAKRSRRRPRGLGGDQVEGRQAVRELLLAGRRRVDEVLMSDDLAGNEVLADIEALSQELGVGVRRITRRHLAAEALTDSHQGVIARAAPLAEADFDRLVDDPGAFLLVLDGITDPGNLGAILRTAECAGVTGVVLGRHRSAHITPTVTKAAAGAIEHVRLAIVAGIPTAIAHLDDRGVTTIGLDGGAPRSIFDLHGAMTGPVALVLGAEGPGLSRLVRQRVGALASIPLAGELNSLNVATATAVACFEVVRARGEGNG